MKSIEEIIKELSQPIPKEDIKKRPQGNIMVDYIPWYYVADKLDKVCPGWIGQIIEVKELGEWVILTYCITINSVSQYGIGCEKLNSKSYAPAPLNAFAQAFKRAAAMFSVGRELYHLEDFSDETDGNNTAMPPVKQAPKPLSKDESGILIGLHGRIREKQVTPKYSALLVEIEELQNTKQYPMKVFVGGKMNPSVEQIAEDLYIDAEVDDEGNILNLPWKCLVDILPRDVNSPDPKRKYDQIVRLYTEDDE